MGDGDGTLAWPEFKEKADDVRVLALFKKLGIDVESQSKKGLFMQFDLDGDGSIEIDEFATALQSVHGNARSLDMMVLRHQNKLLAQKVGALTGVCTEIATLFGLCKASTGLCAVASQGGSLNQVTSSRSPHMHIPRPTFECTDTSLQDIQEDL